MVQSTAATSCYACVLEPIMSSCAHQTISACAQKIVDVVMSIFTTIAAFVKSWLCPSTAAAAPTAQTAPATPTITITQTLTNDATPTATVVVTATSAQTTPPAETANPTAAVPPNAAPVAAASSSPASIEATAASTDSSGHRAEGKLFLKARLERFLNTHGGIYRDAFDVIMKDKTKAIRFLAALIVHDLVMDRDSVEPPLPFIVTTPIENTRTTFISQINNLRTRFLELSDENKAVLKTCFIKENLDLKTPVVELDPVGDRLLAAGIIAQKFVNFDQNPLFMECAQSLWEERNPA